MKEDYEKLLSDFIECIHTLQLSDEKKAKLLEYFEKCMIIETEEGFDLNKKNIRENYPEEEMTDEYHPEDDMQDFEINDEDLMKVLKNSNKKGG